LEEKQMTEMQITIAEIVPGGMAANGKERPTSIHTADGQKLKCWPNKVGSMVAGRTYLVPVVAKQYQGIESFEIGSGIIKEVQTNNAEHSSRGRKRRIWDAGAIYPSAGHHKGGHSGRRDGRRSPTMD
jgi:hypothetical protein